jgi:hypothetical protein
MAGAAPQPRGGAITPVHITLIIFIAVALLTSVLAFYLYLQSDEKVRAAEEARSQLDRARPRQLSDEMEPYWSQARAGNSMADLMMGSIKLLAKDVTGVEKENVSAVLQKRDQLIAEIIDAGQVPQPEVLRGAPLLEVIRLLNTWYMAEHEQSETNRRNAERARTDLQEATRMREGDQQRFNEAIAGLQKDLEKVRSDFNAYKEKTDDQVKEYEAKYGELQDETSEAIRDRETEIRKRDERVQDLQSRIGKLEEIIAKLKPTLDPLQLASEADGRVLSTVIGENVCYIDLGSDQGLELGMTFAVYSPGKPIPADGLGKADIEVIGLDTRVGECRITRSTPGDPVVAGDLVRNPVFSKQRAMRFLVTGRFDLDYDGDFDPDGQQRVEALIRKMGGVVVDHLDEQTDYVVLGSPPIRPADRLPPEANDVVRKQFEENVRQYEAYEALKDEARALTIPMLTQAQFLHLVGYSESKQIPQ